VVKQANLAYRRQYLVTYLLYIYRKVASTIGFVLSYCRVHIVTISSSHVWLSHLLVSFLLLLRGVNGRLMLVSNDSGQLTVDVCTSHVEDVQQISARLIMVCHSWKLVVVVSHTNTQRMRHFRRGLHKGLASGGSWGPKIPNLKIEKCYARFK